MTECCRLTSRVLVGLLGNGWVFDGQGKFAGHGPVDQAEVVFAGEACQCLSCRHPGCSEAFTSAGEPTAGLGEQSFPPGVVAIGPETSAVDVPPVTASSGFNSAAPCRPLCLESESERGGQLNWGGGIVQTATQDEGHSSSTTPRCGHGEALQRASPQRNKASSGLRYPFRGLRSRHRTVVSRQSPSQILRPPWCTPVTSRYTRGQR